MISRTLCRTVPNLSNLFRSTGYRLNRKSHTKSNDLENPTQKIRRSRIPEHFETAANYNDPVCQKWTAHASQRNVILSERSLSLHRTHCCHRRYFSDKAPPDDSKSTPIEDDVKVSQLLDDAASYNEADDPRWATIPYPEGAPVRLQGSHAARPKSDPADTSIILFPGQGTLKVGAIQQYLHLPGVKDLFAAANEAVGYDLLDICLKGPQKVLDRTEYNQPATVVSSLAALEKLREERPRAIDNCVGVAGYSVGELTALIFAGVMSMEDGIRLVAVRGAAMQAAAEMTPQGMMSVHCAQDAKIPEACKRAQTWALDTGVIDPQCRIAIYLYPQGRILAGNKEALRFIETNSRKFGFRRIQWLPVSGAFHTSLMSPALDHFKKALYSVTLEEPRIPVHSNIDGKRYRNTQQIVRFLPKQIVSPVKWEQTMHVLYERPRGTSFPRTFDVGSAGTMKTILKQSNAKAWDTCFVV